MSRFIPISSLLLISCASSVMAGDSWPQWQGLNRDSISRETGLLDRWDSMPPLLWRFDELGVGYSSVVVEDDVVCSIGDYAQDSMDIVALRATDGKLLWRTRIDDAFSCNGAFPGPRSTPTIHDGHFYVLSPAGELFCGDFRNGKLIWSKQLRDDYEGLPPRYGYGESPLIDVNKVICCPGGETAGMVALDKETGEELWRCELPTAPHLTVGHGSMIISHGAGVKQYIRHLGTGVVGIDAATGKLLWHYPRLTGDCLPTPLVRGDYLFVSTGQEGGSALLKLVKSENGVEPQEVYTLDKFVALGSMVLIEDYVYICEKAPACFEFLTGKILWDQADPDKYSATITYADGNLYLYIGATNEMALVQATPKDFEPKGKFQVAPPTIDCLARPAISNGRLYIRQQGSIHCYDLRKK